MLSTMTRTPGYSLVFWLGMTFFLFEELHASRINSKDMPCDIVETAFAICSDSRDCSSVYIDHPRSYLESVLSSMEQFVFMHNASSLEQAVCHSSKDVQRLFGLMLGEYPRFINNAVLVEEDVCQYTTKRQLFYLHLLLIAGAVIYWTKNLQ